ncbi:hypothetical protein EV426DRAFT_643794 [Tirmania nivea]|nr:hypothetical protein EV426DRAFT_643794 [Tirmania nivea]
MDLSLILNPEQLPSYSPNPCPRAPLYLEKHLNPASYSPNPCPPLYSASYALNQFPPLVRMDITTTAPTDESHLIPTPNAISTPAPVFAFGASVVAETSPKRSARNTAKEINYRELANGPSLRLKRDPDSPARKCKRTRTSSSNSTSPSGEGGLSVSSSPELEGKMIPQIVSTAAANDRACEPAMVNGQRPTTGGKSPVLMAELKENLSKLDVDKDRSSSLTPAPEDLEEILLAVRKVNGTIDDFTKAPGVSLRIKQYSYETPASKLTVKATKAQHASVDVDTNGIGVTNDAPHGSPSKKRRRGKVVSYAIPPPIICSEEDIQPEEENMKSSKPPQKNKKREGESTQNTKPRKKPGPKKGWKKARDMMAETTTRTPSSKTEAGDSGQGRTYMYRGEPRLALSNYLVPSSATPSPGASPSILSEELPLNTAIYDIGLENSPTHSPMTNNNASALSFPQSSSSDPPFIPDPITIPDKYSPHRPMTNNQAIKLFDLMCERMDWHNVDLYESVGMQNIFGNRRAAAERFYRGECRRILMTGLAEAEGRMVEAPSNHPPMEVGVLWPHGARVSADIEIEE